MPAYVRGGGGDSDSDGGGAAEDLEAGAFRRKRSRKFDNGVGARMLRSMTRQLQTHHNPAFIVVASFVMGVLCVVALLGHMHDLHMFAGGKTRAGLVGGYGYAHLRDLVVVAGHAVYTSWGCAEAEGDAAWYLETYQRHAGQGSTFVRHIRAGVEAAAGNDKSLLLFSGGETRKEAGPRSEAQSYWSVAETKNWFGKSEKVRDRAMTEEHARDSFENLLFSVCRFRELTGKYPQNITVVSYDFKKFRFANLHRSALRFPASRFTYKGTPTAPSSILEAQQGELAVQESFQRDPYGCEGPLQKKRLRRDPFLRTVPYPAGCPEISGLFSHCGSDIYSKSLPWDE